MDIISCGMLVVIYNISFCFIVERESGICISDGALLHFDFGLFPKGMGGVGWVEGIL